MKERNQIPYRAWFCLRSQRKHESIAAARLREIGIESFSPRIRFKRSTRRGLIWATEALFPTYLFARFDWQESARHVRHVSGVSGIVHFGDKWPTIPDADMAELQERFGDSELHVIDPELLPGDAVQIGTGALVGLTAVIQQIMPSQQRVKVLLDFVGRQTMVEVDRSALILEASPRGKLL